MQTFLPCSNFRETARVLDNHRIGNQVYQEAAILIENKGWEHHPARLMWRGYHAALATYALTLLDEMEERRRWKADVIHRWRTYFREKRLNVEVDMPPWLGDERLHSSHRAVLLAKNPEHYGQFGWAEAPAKKGKSWPYFWPTKELNAERSSR